MTFADWFNYDFEVDIKQDIETYIDWDVDTKITLDIEKDIDVDVDVDIDVKDNGSVVTAEVKDFGYSFDPSDVVIVGDTTAVEDTLSTAQLGIQSDNVGVQLEAGAFDKQATDFASDWGYTDSGTFTEINLGVDHVNGAFTIITLDMQAMVDG